MSMSKTKRRKLRQHQRSAAQPESNWSAWRETDPYPESKTFERSLSFNREAINEEAFGQLRRSADLTRRIQVLAEFLKGTLYDFVEKFIGNRGVMIGSTHFRSLFP